MAGEFITNVALIAYFVIILPANDILPDDKIPPAFIDYVMFDYLARDCLVREFPRLDEFANIVANIRHSCLCKYKHRP